MSGANDQLETDFVFIDTEAFVRERLDWNSRAFSRLKELVRSGHLHILTTRVTREEVVGKIRESLAIATAALRKHDVVLRQLGFKVPVDEGSEERTVKLFEEFLRELRAIEVPVSRDVDKILHSYFHQLPPFSAKKKNEFPDAFVVQSLQERVTASRRKIYVVSADPDMKSSCESVAELLLVDSISEVISRATVTKAVHDSLLSFLQRSGRLRAQLETALYSSTIRIEGRYAYDGIADIDASFAGVDQITILNANVISQHADEFTVDIEFEACVIVDLNFAAMSRSASLFDDDFDLVPRQISHSHAQVISAEVVVRYDYEETSESEIESIYCNPTITVNLSDFYPAHGRRGF